MEGKNGYCYNLQRLLLQPATAAVATCNTNRCRLQQLLLLGAFLAFSPLVNEQKAPSNTSRCRLQRQPLQVATAAVASCNSSR